MTQSIVQRVPTVIPVEGKALGRNKLLNWHQVARLTQADATTSIATVSHKSNLKTCLDQGSLGSCTGNATTHCKCSQPYTGVLTETDAVNCYHLATIADDSEIPGHYPPNDTGSTGWFAMQAAIQLGWFSSASMAVGLTAVLQCLQTRPGITGIDWYEGFDEPDANGFVFPTGRIRGGHEIGLVACVIVLGANGLIDPKASYIVFQNSWGASYGVTYDGRDGCFKMTLETYELILASGGDATFADAP